MKTDWMLSRGLRSKAMPQSQRTRPVDDRAGEGKPCKVAGQQPAWRDRNPDCTADLTLACRETDRSVGTPQSIAGNGRMREVENKLVANLRHGRNRSPHPLGARPAEAGPADGVLRGSFNGRTSVFQTEDPSSILGPRSDMSPSLTLRGSADRNGKSGRSLKARIDRLDEACDRKAALTSGQGVGQPAHFESGGVVKAYVNRRPGQGKGTRLEPIQQTRVRLPSTPTDQVGGTHNGSDKCDECGYRHASYVTCPPWTWKWRFA